MTQTTPELGMNEAEIHLKIGDVANIIGVISVEVVAPTPGMPDTAVAAINVLTLIGGIRDLADQLEIAHGISPELVPEPAPLAGRFRIRLSDLAGTLMDRPFDTREAAQEHIDRAILSMPKHRVDPRWADAVVEEMEA